MSFAPLTDFASSPRGKWVTLAVWISVAGLIIGVSPTLSDITTNDDAQFLPEDAESTQAAELARTRYPTDSTPAIIVFHNPDGLTEENFAAAEQVNNEITTMAGTDGSNVSNVVSIFTVPQARDEFISPDGTTMTMIVNITGSSTDDAYSDRIDAIRDVTDAAAEGDLQVKVSGPGGLISDLVSVFANIDSFLLIVTVSLVLVLLIIIYRSPVVALVPILLVGLVFQLSSGVGAVILDAVDFAVSGQTTGIMTVILFGAGTDYILFISARYREELTLREDKHEAMRRSMRGVGGALTSAAGTLIVASSILLLADLRSYKSLGPVIAIAIALMLLASLTLVPAILTILGRFSFWPFSPAHEPDTSERDEHGASPIWTRIARFVLERPGTVLATTSAVLLLLAAGTFRLETTYDTLQSLPSNVDSAEGFELLREGFPPGELAPTAVYVEFPASESAFNPDHLQAVAAISQGLQEIEGVVAISSPAFPQGTENGVGPDAVLQAIEQVPPEIQEAIEEGRRQGGGSPPPEVNPDSELARAIGLYASSLAFLSTDQGVARIDVTLDVNPYSNEALDLIPVIRDTARDIAEQQGVPRDNVVTGGETAESYDTRVANTRDTFVVLPLVLVSIMIILGLLLRSVVAAAYLGATITFTYFSTLGLSVLVWRYLLGQDTTGSSVPFFLFVFLNALGVDYSIYLMSRIREEVAGHELGVATERALARTGGVISSAGLILAGTFGALMTLPLRDLFQLGFAVSIGVLMDTFITRSLLVPSIVKLLGHWNWWPSRAPGAQPTLSTAEPTMAQD